MSFCARKPWLKSGQLDEEASSLIAYISNFCSFSVPLTFFSVSITLSDGKLCRNQSLSFMFLAHLSSTCVSYNLKSRPTGRVSRYRSVDSKFDLCIIWMSFLSSASVDSAIWNYLSRSNFSHVVRWTSCELCSGLHEKSLFRTENGGDFFLSEKLFPTAAVFDDFQLFDAARRKLLKLDQTLGPPHRIIFASCLIFDYHNNGTEQFDIGGWMFLT